MVVTTAEQPPSPRPARRGPARAPAPPAAARGRGVDEDLVAAVADGDHDALAELYRRYGGAVWAVARRVCNDRTLAEDVTQTVFVDLWRRPRRFDPARGALRPWLVAQAHARAVDVVRSEAARRRRHERESLYAPPPSPDVEAAAHLATLSADVRRAVDQLAADEREAIVLAYFGGHSYRETAALLAAPEGTIKSRIRRGLAGLRQVLDAQGIAP
ncbi:MAG TPA: sigma-70 family RNA polymerase sigma factor [Acidimicrobiales bacterium]